EMGGLTVPVVSVVIGEGGSGGALALGVGNKVHMLENSTYSVISPEGAAALLWTDASQAQRAAESMRITAPDLKELNIIDEIITEPMGGAHRDIEMQARHIDNVLQESLQELTAHSNEEVQNQRWEKFSKIGNIKES